MRERRKHVRPLTESQQRSLRAAMAAARVSQRKLAELLDIHTSLVSRFLRGVPAHSGFLTEARRVIAEHEGKGGAVGTTEALVP